MRGYRNCRFCRATGRSGCLACQAESDKDYKEAFPDGPQPIATFDTSTPEKAAEVGKLLSNIFSGCEKETEARAKEIEEHGSAAIQIAQQIHGLSNDDIRSVVRRIAQRHVMLENIEKAGKEASK